VDLTIAGFIQNLTEATTAMEVFRTDLQVITEAGFADLAALIAEQGPEIGGSLAAEMADAIRTGNVEIVEAAQEAVTGFQNEWDLTVEWFRSTLGPEMILEAGLLGSGLTDAFGSELSFDERLRIAGGLAKLQMSAEGKAVAAIAAAEGDRAARRYGEALGLDEQVINEAIKAGNRLRNVPTG